MRNRDILFIIRMQNQARTAAAQFASNLRGIAAAAQQATAAIQRMNAAGARIRPVGGAVAPSGRSSGSGGTGGGGGGSGGGSGGGGGFVAAVAGLNPLRSQMSAMVGTVTTLRGALNALALAFSAVVIVRTLGDLRRMADAYSTLTSRISFATNSAAEHAAVMDELFRVANQNTTGVEEQANLYYRLDLALKRLGLSQQRIIDLSDTVTKTLRISGATAAETSGTLIQFSQALANDFSTSAQELNSINEQVPALANIIAEGLGKIRGQSIIAADLKKLAEDGKLTAADVVESLELMKDKVDELFAKRTPRIDNAFSVLANNTLRAVGELDQKIGASRAVVNYIQFIGQYWSAIKSFFEMAGNVLFQYDGHVASLNGVLRVASENIGTMAQKVSEFMRGLEPVMAQTGNFIRSAIGGTFEFIFNLLNNLKRGIADFADTAINSAVTVGVFFQTLWQLIADNGSAALNLIIGKIQGIGQASTEALSGDFQKAWDTANNALAGGFQFDWSAFDQFPQRVRDIMDRANVRQLVETSVGNAAGAISSATLATLLENTERANREVAAKRMLSNPRPKIPGLPKEPKEDKAGKRAANKFDSEVDALVNKVAPYIARQRELNEAITIYNKLLGMSDSQLAKYGLSQEKLVPMLEAIKREYGAYADVMTRLGRELDEQLSLSGLAASAREIETKIIQAQNAAIKDGLPLRDAEIQSLRERMKQVQIAERVTELKQGVNDRLAEIAQEIELTKVLAVAREDAAEILRFESEARKNDVPGSVIGEQVTRIKTAMAERKAAFLAAQQDMVAGAREGWDAITAQAMDMRGQITGAVTSTFNGLTDVITQFALTGKANLADFANSVISEFARIGVQTAVFRVAGAALGMPVPLRHSGGPVDGMTGEVRNVNPLVFAYAKRYHAGLSAGPVGGLKSGEVPIIAKKGEVVGWPDQLRKQYGGGTTNVAVTPQISVTVNQTNNSSGQQSGAPSDAGANLGREIGRQIEAAMNDWGNRQRRPGGIFYGN